MGAILGGLEAVRVEDVDGGSNGRTEGVAMTPRVPHSGGRDDVKGDDG